MNIFGYERMNPQPKRKKPLKHTSVAYKTRVMQCLERDGYQCRGCGRKLDKSMLTAHHIKTIGAGGSDDLNNLITVCSICHGKIHNGNLSIASPPRR